MNHKQKFTPPAVGASSLMVVFAVLCLTVFALLSVSTARADGRLSHKANTAITGYYEADYRAEEVLAQLRAGIVPAGVTREEGMYTYRCPISDTQVLIVQVSLEGSAYKIHRWQAVSTTDWQADDRIPVWDGQRE